MRKHAGAASWRTSAHRCRRTVQTFRLSSPHRSRSWITPTERLKLGSSHLSETACSRPVRTCWQRSARKDHLRLQPGRRAWRLEGARFSEPEWRVSYSALARVAQAPREVCMESHPLDPTHTKRGKAVVVLQVAERSP